MAKIDLDSLSIEEVAAFRDNATDKLMEKVAARRAELEAELEKLAQYDRPARKSAAVAPIIKPKKADEAKEPIAKESIGTESIAKEQTVKEPTAKEPAAKAA
jgi:hypothetical protein